MAPKHLAAALLTAGSLVAGCGGGDEGEDLAGEDAVRDCLTDAGFAAEPPGGSTNTPLGSVSPDFRLASETGGTLDVAILGTTEKAERAAADVRGALGGFGVAAEDVVQARNAVAVFDPSPPEAERSAVEACLAG